MKKNIICENKKIFYHVYGKGSSVLLVHGFGEDETVWENQIEFLKDKFLLIVPQLPGIGQSEIIVDMSMEGIAEILHSIIHEENINTCMLIGHSMGGYIGLAFAEKYPNHLNKFGLVHSSGFADTEEKKVTRKKGIEFIDEHGAFEFLKTTTPNLFSSITKSESKEVMVSFIENLSGISSETLVANYQAMMKRPDRTSVLKNSNFPVLIVAGEHDNAVPLADCLEQSYLPDICFFHILHNSGHMGMLEEPGKLNRILEEFLS